MNTNPFQFNRRIDAGILSDLYENDYLYVEEIFKITLQHFDGDIEVFKNHFKAGSLEGLRSTAHKMKPVFNYIGIPDVQEYCKGFELSCAKAGSVEELFPEYKQLLQQFEECRRLLEDDLQKLSEYNRNTS